MQNYEILDLSTDNLRVLLRKSSTNFKILDTTISGLLEKLDNATVTDGNKELADIRVGADGTTYESAGDAVRAISTALSDTNKKIVELANKLASLEGSGGGGGISGDTVILDGGRLGSE